MKVLFGAENCAEQCFHWANSLRMTGLRSDSVGFPSTYGFRSHITVNPLLLRSRISGLAKEDSSLKRSLLNYQDFVLNQYDVFFIDYFQPILNWEGLGSLEVDLDVLLAAGKRVYLIAHGGDVIEPNKHIELEPFSPFKSLNNSENIYFTAQAQRNRRLSSKFKTLYTTPNLVEFVQDGEYLPIAVDPELVSEEICLKDPPRVIHAPTDPMIKGTKYFESTLLRLNKMGLIKYIRLPNLRQQVILNHLRHSDWLIDQVALGYYGVLGAQAMRLGKLVFGHIGSYVKSNIAVIEIQIPDFQEQILHHLSNRENEMPLRRQLQDSSDIHTYASVGRRIRDLL